MHLIQLTNTHITLNIANIRTNEPGLVERNPVTNQVDNPAHIQVSAEDTPAKVVELMRLKKPQNSLI